MKKNLPVGDSRLQKKIVQIVQILGSLPLRSVRMCQEFGAVCSIILVTKKSNHIFLGYEVE
jgi:hypothetical protein